MAARHSESGSPLAIISGPARTQFHQACDTRARAPDSLAAAGWAPLFGYAVAAALYRHKATAIATVISPATITATGLAPSRSNHWV